MHFTRIGYMAKTYGVRNNLPDRLDTVLQILRAYRSTATFFITARWLERNEWAAKEIQRHGHDIQPHGYRHKYFYARDDLAKSYEDIARATATFRRLGLNPTGYRAPYSGEADRPPAWYFTLYGQGVEWDSSTVVRDYRRPRLVPVPGTIPPRTILEIPIHATDNYLAGRVETDDLTQIWLTAAEAAKLADRPVHFDLHPIRANTYAESLKALLETAGPSRTLSTRIPEGFSLLLSCDIDQAAWWDYLRR